MIRPVPVFALCAAVAFGVLTTGCTRVVQGEAVKLSSSVPADDVPPLEDSALDGVLLSNSELSKIAGVDLESLYTAEEMNDNADSVSYPGEDAVYRGTDWTAVRDELLIEASDDEGSRLVEQTLVLYDSADTAVEFFEASKAKWGECAQKKDIEVEDGPWVPEKVQDVDERTISLKAEVSGTLDGICGHSMGVVANLIVEGFSCDVDDRDDAQTITGQLLDNAAEQ